MVIKYEKNESICVMKCQFSVNPRMVGSWACDMCRFCHIHSEELQEVDCRYKEMRPLALQEADLRNMEVHRGNQF